MRQTLAAQREAKMKKLHPPAPPPPKVFLAPKKLLVPQSCHMSHVLFSQEITVVAGDGKPVKIHLGGENELEDCRRQVTVYPLILSFSLFLLLDNHEMTKHFKCQLNMIQLRLQRQQVSSMSLSLSLRMLMAGRFLFSSVKHGTKIIVVNNK